MKNLDQLAFIHYDMRQRVRNLILRIVNDDYYNPIGLSRIFKDDDPLDVWIRENDEIVLER